MRYLNCVRRLVSFKLHQYIIIYKQPFRHNEIHNHLEYHKSLLALPHISLVLVMLLEHNPFTLQCWNVHCREFNTYSQCCRFSIQPLTILGVTGPFSVLAENIYSLCVDSFDVCGPLWCMGLADNIKD